MMESTPTGYECSRAIFDFAHDHPERIKPGHIALYLWCVELCNKLGWKEKFTLPTQQAMETIGVRNRRTFRSLFDDLVAWRFIHVIQPSRNQYQAAVISLGTGSACAKNTQAKKVPVQKTHKHPEMPVQKIHKHCHSTAHIYKHIKPYKTKRGENEAPPLYSVREFFLQQTRDVDKAHTMADMFWNHYQATGWKVGETPIVDWRPKARQWIERQKRYDSDSGQGDVMTWLQMVNAMSRDGLPQTAFEILDGREGRPLQTDNDGKPYWRKKK